jgi:hypothetical protein
VVAPDRNVAATEPPKNLAAAAGISNASKFATPDADQTSGWRAIATD